uniref:NADH:ubiquinone reductase (H(+)-translocating) n=1 Tax=Crassostrea tulipa TaxID=2912563 RepID=A0A0K0PXN1_9BIVA|nr:NADH dehydrogenase subunit 5 [Crassostrea gasar]AKQ78431.1 NADH dehydrogenase subunit 5 [Crassostrea gasar]
MVVLNSFMLIMFSSILCVISSFMGNFGLTYWFCWELGSVGLLSFNLEVCFDWMTTMFVAVILLISSCVGIFMDVYMSESKNDEFNFLVYAFISSMIILVVAGSMPVVLMGWDWLGVTSFLLVMFYEGKKSFDASMITALTNRVGDALLICSTAGMILACDVSLDMKPYCWGVVFAFGCVTKSAQVPFSSWLPAAMMAPTPVSSLVHSSTLVTAGIFLLIRSFKVWSNSPLACGFLICVGLVTSVMAGISAVMEMDMKKIIALSTLSQLGIMAFCLGLGEVVLAFMHLLCHAFFKAGMFLSAGSLISHNSGNQYFISFSGSEVTNSPLAVLSLFVGSVSLIGIPGTAGYASKESIVAFSYNIISWPALILLFFSVALTMVYSFRIIAGLTNSIKTGARDFSSLRENIWLSLPGAVLVLFGMVGGELVATSSINNCYFETAASSEVWFWPYFSIFLGVVIAVLVRLMFVSFYESGTKSFYGMLLLDYVSRSMVSDGSSLEFSESGLGGEAGSEVQVPQGVWEFGASYLSGLHNFAQRGQAVTLVTGSAGLGASSLLF